MQSRAKSFNLEAVGQTANSAFREAKSDERDALLTAAIANAQTSAAEGILDAVVEMLAAGPAGFTRDQRLLTRLVRARPELAAQRSVWDTDDPAAVWAAVKFVRAKGMRRAIVSAMVEQGADVNRSAVLEAWPTAADVVLDTLAAGDGRVAGGEEWLTALSPEAVGVWAAAAAADEPDTFLRLLEMLPGAVVAEMSGDAFDELAFDKLETPALLSVFLGGIGSRSPKHGVAATRAYGGLYEPALAGQLGGVRDRLDALQVDVPVWDVALRLSRSLNRAYQENPTWPLTAIGHLPAPAFAALVASDSKAELARRVVAQHIELDQAQLDVISRLIASKSDRDSLAKTLRSLLSAVNPF
jgi:hypothetical protein